MANVTGGIKYVADKFGKVIGDNFPDWTIDSLRAGATIFGTKPAYYIVQDHLNQWATRPVKLDLSDPVKAALTFLDGVAKVTYASAIVGINIDNIRQVYKFISGSSNEEI